MTERKSSLFSNGLLWFGAAVSIAEILTGTLIAPLGFQKGLTAIIIGHVIGCALLFCAGLIGGKTGKSSMETVKISFGQKGSLLFSTLNILQLVGWTAVMIVSGAAAANAIVSLGGSWIWCLLIGALVGVWTLLGRKNLNRINAIAMGGLFLLTFVLSFSIFGGGGSATAPTGGLSFGGAVELSVAMPLSWLPLISDYTRSAKKPVLATGVSSFVYFFVSIWMYVIGMGAVLFTGESHIAPILLQAGLGVIGLLIIVFSTVTTTFLDVYSAGVSAVSVTAKCKEKPMALLVCLAGTALAIFTPITQFESFLYLIGSVFAPMIAIQIADFFVTRKNASCKGADWPNLVLWAIGFALYRIFMHFDTPVGSTFPVMLITAGLCILVHYIKMPMQRRLHK